MTGPDLSNDEAYRAYRTELRAVGRTPRLVGFALIVLGTIAVWAGVKAGAAGPAIQWGGYAALAAGWVLMLWAIFLRTRYHRHRMREHQS